MAHSFNTPFLLVEIRMNIKIKRRRNIRVSKYDTYSFIITLAFNTSGCKRMPKSMKDQMWNV